MVVPTPFQRALGQLIQVIPPPAENIDTGAEGGQSPFFAQQSRLV